MEAGGEQGVPRVPEGRRPDEDPRPCGRSRLEGRPARWLHALTAVAAAAALVLQFALIWSGHAVLDETRVPPLGARVVRFFCYFTVLSNLLVAVTCALAAAGRTTGQVFRVLRLNAIVGIALTGVVHFLLLRPLLDLHGANWVADRSLHVVVPVLAVLGWLLAGPRDGVERGDLAPATIYPASYLVLTLAHGAATGWYPYRFVDVGELGYPRVLLHAAALFALLVGLNWAAWRLDRVLGERQLSPRRRPR